MKLLLKTVFPMLMFLIVGTKTMAFPEMVKHNYPHCSSCHLSPSGGGVLTEYGREISEELLSFASVEGEEDFAYGLVKTPKWLSLMGLFRRVNLYMNVPNQDKYRSIPMESDLEIAVHDKTWIVDATVGYKYLPKGQRSDNYFLSRRHFIAFRPNDNVSVRGGRFFPNMGIMTPDHIIPTRRDIGFDEGMETYNLEFAYLQRNWSAFLTLYTSRGDVPDALKEKGVILTPAIILAQHYKVGLNFLYADKEFSKRNLYGAWGILGFTKKFFLLTEVDYQKTTPVNKNVDPFYGLVNYQRLDYEIVQGIHMYATQEYSQSNLKTGNIQRAYSLGSQIFPRPHFEVNLAWQKRKSGTLPKYYDYAYLMLNFYL